MNSATFKAAFALAGLAAILAPAQALAGEPLPLLKAPAAATAPEARFAGEFELKILIPEGRGLAQFLLDAGVDQGDAAAAARLAAGHLGDGAGGCQAKVLITRPIESSSYRIERVTVFTASDHTVIERRGKDLAIASQSANSKYPRLI